MFKGVVQFGKEIFQDTDGGASSKRVAFFIFVLLFVALSLAVVLHGLSANVTGFANSVLDKTQDIIKWLGAYILADKAPAALTALKGGKSSDTPDHPTGG